MCGIAGFIDMDSNWGRTERLIASMCNVIRHRGPDDQGVWIGAGMALGMRRLSIIDRVGGQQPIFNEDRSIVVVFNGEIYNYHELKTQLRERGHRFRTQSDTETIVHAYEEYGDECVNHLRGMFAFALWDGRRQRLLAARDRFGKKPLNYFWDGRRLIFGSEIKSILQAGIPREVNPIALDEYLVYCYVPAPNTLFKHIFKLPAAHMLIYENGRIRTKRYWDLSFAPTCQDDEATAIERTRELLRDAVKVRLMSEVPLGAFLSGGIDSSLVVALMSSMMPQAVKTFSIGFDEGDYSELTYARRIANSFGTEHHEFFVRPDLISVLPELVWAYDEPFADVSMLPTFYVSKLAREHVTVVLTGDGGDEIFGGYTRYARELTIESLPALLRLLLAYAGKVMPDGMRGKKRLQSLGGDLANRYTRTLASLPGHLRPCLYTREYLATVAHHDPYEQLIRRFTGVSHLDIMAQMQHADVETYLTDDILVKVDKASMLNSLETRAPLLDQFLVEYAASLPSHFHARGGVLKSLLKKVAADMLPEAIVTRPKRGFGVPIQRWLRADLAGYARELLDLPRAHQRGIFNPQFIRHLLTSHAHGRLINHGEAIWTLLCLEVWFQTYMDQSSIEEHVAMQATSNF